MGGGLYETFDHIGTIFPELHLVTAETCPMFYMFYSRESGHLRENKNKRKFQTFSSKSGHSHCIQEVPNIVIDLETFGTFENWLLRKGVHLHVQEV